MPANYPDHSFFKFIIMAKQSAIIPFEGTLGNITFYKSEDGYRVKRKSAVSKKRLATDPAFQRTRENGAEFGAAGRGGKALRMALQELLKNASDSKLISRLTRDLLRVLQADTVNARGKRRIADGDLGLLGGFDFNINGTLSATLWAPFSTIIDRVAGTLSISIPSFVPDRMLQVPEGASHYRISSAGVAVDFEQKKHEGAVQHTAVLPWNNQASVAVTLTNAVTAGSSLPLFLAMGVEFYQEMNGSLYPLKDASFNCLSLVAVSGS
jgi:hypothetical protein